MLSISSVLTTGLYILLAIIVLLFMIMIHELGHYTAGKLLKFKINEFAIGFGKPIIKKTKKNGEVFSLRLIPLGGFCAFEGEDEDKPETPDSFNNQKPWKRLIVLFMGAFFNFLSAIIFAVVFLMAFGYNDKVQVNSVTLPQSVQAESWLMKGDVIYAVNGKETNFIYDEYFTTLINDFKVDEDFTVSVYRNGEDIDLTIHKSWFNCDSKVVDGKTVFALDGVNYVYAIKDGNKIYNINSGENARTFTADENGLVAVEFVTEYGSTTETFLLENDNGEVTISSTKIGITTQNYRYGFFEAIGGSFKFCFGWAWKILMILGQLITGQLAITSMGGTVTTVVTIAEVTQTNIASLLLLIPLISINLAVFNLLPFPALDGARMVFVLIEWIRRKPINRKVEGTIHFIGLMALLVFVVIVDILHFVI